jgi:hypothetical protein
LERSTYVGTSELLEHLQPHPDRKTIRHLWRLPHTDPLLNRTVRYRRLRGKFSFHFLELHLDAIVVLWHAIYIHHRLGRLVNFALAEVESRRFGEEHDAHGEDDSPYKCESHSDLPRGGFAGLVAFGSIVEDCGEEDAESDHELVCRDQGAANVTGCSFGLIKVTQLTCP